MKNRYLMLVLTLLFGVTVKAQNTFPASANVGIGTISPSEKLHVYRLQAGYYNPVVVLEDALNTGYTQLAFKGTGRSYHLGLGNAGETGLGLANKFYIWDQNATSARVVLDANGNLGIGTTTPGNRLSIYSATASSSGLQFSRLNSGSTAITGNGKVLSLDVNGNVILVNDGVGVGGWLATGNSGTNPSTNYFGTSDNQPLAFRTNNIERLRLLNNGNLNIVNSVGIGTDSINDPNYRLFVARGIRTRKVRVDVGAWPDYVFDSSYALLSLKEVEHYVIKNKHLPDVLSADQVDKEGLDLGQNQSVLLKKIEELTLYIIEHNKTLEKLGVKIEQQSQQINTLKQQLKERE